MKYRISGALTITCVVGACFVQGPLWAEQKAAEVPIIYTTDLYHPHQDPDDHFDIATLFALPEFKILGIVIDMGEKGKGRAGTVPLEQMMYLSGVTVPYATGLAEKLSDPNDTGQGQPAAAQKGVELILDALRRAEEPVTVFTTGSLRDVAAAYNREPALFAKKVDRLYANAGHSGGGDEYNVELDPAAYLRILRSDLAVYWVPCFGERGYESMWHFNHGEVLDAAPAPIQNFFLYALGRIDPKEKDPVDVLAQPVDADLKRRFWDKRRNMWCTGAFLHAAGRTGGPFRFEDVFVKISDEGNTKIVEQEKDTEVLKTFRKEAPFAYLVTMKGELRRLLEDFPMAVEKKSEEE